ncbi:TetR family transcriptional regulator [Rhodococcus hoagii]|nr:TetR family transcriptional regulator [Prescottella equi]
MRSRKKILDATLGLIGSAGFEGVNIAAVAAAAGVTRQTVYSIFGTREDLVSHAIAAPSRCSATSVPGSRPGSRLRAALRRGRPSVVRSEDHHRTKPVAPELLSPLVDRSQALPDERRRVRQRRGHRPVMVGRVRHVGGVDAGQPQVGDELERQRCRDHGVEQPLRDEQRPVVTGGGHAQILGHGGMHRGFAERSGQQLAHRHALHCLGLLVVAQGLGRVDEFLAARVR